MAKVCHMTSVHPSRDVRIFYKMCVSLATEGYGTYLVAPGESFEENGVHVIGVGEKPVSRIKRMTGWAKLVYQKALEIDADIYHFHDPELLPYGLKLKRKGKIVIFDSHEFYGCHILSKNWIPRTFRSLIAKAYMIFETYVCRRIDAVVAICTLEGKNYFENKTSRLSYITNVPLLSEFNRPAEWDKTKTKICYVGGLSEERGITNIIKAAHSVKTTLCLAGNFSSAQYEEELRQLPQWECVDYKGYLNRQQVTDMLGSSIAGMCTLLDIGQFVKLDAFPVKILEYMAIGLPVISNKSYFIFKEFSELNCGICVNPENIDEIAAAIKYLFDNQEEARQMGENGRRAVLEKYNWEIEEKKLFALYKELLKQETRQ